MAVVGAYIVWRLRADSDLDFRPHGARQTVRDWLSVSTLGGRVVLGVQFAGAAILLISAGLVVRSVVNLRNQPLGYDASDVALISLAPGLQGYTPSRAADLFERLRERVDVSAGVASATFAFVDVVSGQGRRETIESPQATAAGSHSGCRGQSRRSTLFRNAWHPGESGPGDRGPRSSRRRTSRRRERDVRTHVLRWYGSRPPFSLGGFSGKDPGVEIIGIVSDIKYRSVRAPSPALVYIPVMQDPVADATLYVRSTLPASAILTTVRQEITRLDPGVAPFNVRTLDRQVDESLATERGLSFLATALGLLALVLTSVGLAASLAQSDHATNTRDWHPTRSRCQPSTGASARRARRAAARVSRRSLGNAARLSCDAFARRDAVRRVADAIRWFSAEAWLP